MKAVFLLFDSLKRDWLPPYGGDIVAPNFSRLAARAATFDNFWVGSLPCMPARRELHTGRYNFLHRGWGPLEPFDDSVPEILRNSGVHTHLVSDHHHYWREGGANYHNRYSTWEMVRGQEGDPWKGEPGAQWVNTASSDEIPSFFRKMFVQDTVNRRHMASEETHCQTLVFDAGLEFIETNADRGDWLLQIESFDPHEPFYTFDQYRKLYPGAYAGRHVDWPLPGPADQEADYVRYVQNQYKALVSMIDRNLGRVLDAFDRHDLWKDTMLVVSTDHGLLLGEHEWWSKGMMPAYNEISRIPMFVWDPRCPEAAGVRRKALAQNIDVAATFLEFFGRPLPPDMEGVPLRGAIRDDSPAHDFVLFGYHGGNAWVTDGRHAYMRGPVSPENGPLYEYTLIPARMGSRTEVKDLQNLELAEPFAFTKGCRTLKIAMGAHAFPGSPYRFGSMLFDLEADPGQRKPLDDPDTELRLVREMIRLMRRNDAPPEQFERLGLRDDLTARDLADQRRAFLAARRPDILTHLDWDEGALNQLKTLGALLHDPGIAERFGAYVGERGIARIEPAVVMAFAESVLDPRQAGMALMMLRLNARLD